MFFETSEFDFIWDLHSHPYTIAFMGFPVIFTSAELILSNLRSKKYSFCELFLGHLYDVVFLNNSECAVIPINFPVSFLSDNKNPGLTGFMAAF